MKKRFTSSKKFIMGVFLIFSLVVAVHSQSTENDNKTDAESTPGDTGRKILREMLVTSFEDPTMWKITVPEDEGRVTVRRIFGGAGDKEVPSQEGQDVFVIDEYVLGVKTEFFRRSETTINIGLQRSLFIPGKVEKLSLWVLGRDRKHKLSAKILDMDGNILILPLGELKFEGWQKLEVDIPDSFEQQNSRRGNFFGIFLLGLQIDTHFEDTVGTFYAYFDDLRVIRDVMIDANKTGDDISDGW